LFILLLSKVAMISNLVLALAAVALPTSLANPLVSRQAICPPSFQGAQTIWRGVAKYASTEWTPDVRLGGTITNVVRDNVAAFATAEWNVPATGHGNTYQFRYALVSEKQKSMANNVFIGPSPTQPTNLLLPG
jgi:hypothetical protein